MDGSNMWANGPQSDNSGLIESWLGSCDTDIAKALGAERLQRKRLKVMIADDDEFISNLALRALSRSCDVVQAFCGEDTVSAYLSEMPNVLFLDIELGDVSGLDLVKGIMRVDPDAHIVMFSGHTYGENVRAAVEEGAKGFIAKPFPTASLNQQLLRYAKQNGFCTADFEAK